jgi:hypothetical protein
MQSRCWETTAGTSCAHGLHCSCHCSEVPSGCRFFTLLGGGLKIVHTWCHLRQILKLQISRRVAIYMRTSLETCNQDHHQRFVTPSSSVVSFCALPCYGIMAMIVASSFILVIQQLSYLRQRHLDICALRRARYSAWRAKKVFKPADKPPTLTTRREAHSGQALRSVGSAPDERCSIRGMCCAYM